VAGPARARRGRGRRVGERAWAGGGGGGGEGAGAAARRDRRRAEGDGPPDLVGGAPLVRAPPRRRPHRAGDDAGLHAFHVDAGRFGRGEPDRADHPADPLTAHPPAMAGITVTSSPSWTGASKPPRKRTSSSLR